MKESIEKFCENHDNGLFLLDMPTGFGKTHSVLEFIAENYDNPKYEKIKFFFITTLKKNLPFNKLREHFQKRGKEKDFDKYCMQIDANMDCVVDKLLPLYREKKIPVRIKQRKEFMDLMDSVQLINNYKKKMELAIKPDPVIVNLIKNAEKAIRDTQERAFRNLIISELAKFDKPLDRLKEIENNPEYQWIGELYPAVYTRSKKVYFMSMDKFILGNTTLIERTYSFYNNKIINNAIIFIDEFDSTKDRMLNQIIRRGLDNHVNYLTLFTQIHSSLKMRSFPAELTTDSTKRREFIEANPYTKTCNDIIDGFEKILDETYKKYDIQYSFRTENDSNLKDTNRNFLFNDLQFHSVFSKGMCFVQISADDKNKQNWLKFIKKKPTDNDSGILGLLSSVKGCVSYFQNGCRTLSYNYKDLQDEKRKADDDDFTFENAVKSVLSEFNLSSEFIRYLVPVVLSSHKKGPLHTGSLGKGPVLNYLDRSVYDRGFRYYDFIDAPDHNMQSEIQLYDFQDSPERILLHVSEKARVIGISATASMDTVIGNYDLEYIKRMLNHSFYELPLEDECRLRQNFEKFIEEYHKVNIHIVPVEFYDDYKKDLKEIFSSSALIKKYAEKLENQFLGSNSYAAANFLRIVKVLKAFICNDEMRSFLCLSNKLAQENKVSYDLKLLQEFTKDIIRESNLPYSEKELIANINGENFDAKYKVVRDRLSSGEKIFIISSYSTVGAGQNLQYTTPIAIPVVKVNQYEREENIKDIDGIYLEKPTNLIVNIDSKNALSAEELIRFIYQIEFMMERGDISRKDGVSCIKDAFVIYSGGNFISGRKGVLYETPSVNNYAIRTLIQAVGRICRTGLKNNNIFIYVDDEILRKFDFSKVESRMLNPEFRALVETGKQYREGIVVKDDRIVRLENAAGQLSLKTMHIINDLMRNFIEYNIIYWRCLRQLVLKCPTMSRGFVNTHAQYKNIYMEAPCKISSYSYTQEGDYNKNIIIKFDGSLPQKMSEEEVKLKELFNIVGLREYFESKGYATSFIPNEYILTPPMFNNIYKGALGEEVGKYILEKYLSVELKDMPDELFERFDYTIGNGIYIDFKLWKDSMQMVAAEEKKAILKKLDECNGRRAIIINIINDKDVRPITSAEGRIVEIPYLYRIDRHEIGVEILQHIISEGYLK